MYITHKRTVQQSRRCETSTTCVAMVRSCTPCATETVLCIHYPAERNKRKAKGKKKIYYACGSIAHRACLKGPFFFTELIIGSLSAVAVEFKQKCATAVMLYMFIAQGILRVIH